VSGSRAILGIVAAYATDNRGTKPTKNFPSSVGSFASAKVYVPLSRECWVRPKQ